MTFIGFAMGTNIYFQGPNPDGTQTADGNYHPEDEVYLPWFMRLSPNSVSEPTQILDEHRPLLAHGRSEPVPRLPPHVRPAASPTPLLQDRKILGLNAIDPFKDPPESQLAERPHRLRRVYQRGSN